jgi:hypothetical protein
MPSYAEISPSLTGIKIIARIRLADLPEVRRLLEIPAGDKEQARTIPFGERANGQQHVPGAQLFPMGRYFTITGRHWVSSPRDAALLSLDRYSRPHAVAGYRARSRQKSVRSAPSPSDRPRAASAF